MLGLKQTKNELNQGNTSEGRSSIQAAVKNRIFTRLIVLFLTMLVTVWTLTTFSPAIANDVPSLEVTTSGVTSQKILSTVESHIEAFNSGSVNGLNVGDNVTFSARPFVQWQRGIAKIQQDKFQPLLDRWEVTMLDTTVEGKVVSGEVSILVGAHGRFSGTAEFSLDAGQISSITYEFDRKSQDRILAMFAPPNQSFVPLMDMTEDDLYKGQDGGLYGGGLNVPPSEHEAAAFEELAKIEPLDEYGNPSPDGKIVFTSIGMSNAEMKFEVFKQVADEDPEKSANVVVVVGAQGGVPARSWAKNDYAWRVLEERLEDSSVTTEQVQVVWIEHGTRYPIDTFPSEVQDLQGYLTLILQELNERYPNVRIVYLSSRTYAGYAKVNLNAEPHAYESAFAVRWLIEDQIDGNPDLNYDPAQGTVKSPLLLWGPYMWADGLTPRSDGLTWSQGDYLSDGTHPSTSGRMKVAEMLLDFLKTDEYAGAWYTGSP